MLQDASNDQHSPHAIYSFQLTLDESNGEDVVGGADDDAWPYARKDDE